MSKGDNPTYHIACAILVWVSLALVPKQTGETLYRIKPGCLINFYDNNLKTQGSICALHKPDLL
jgi:hypothetical protein